MILPFDFGTREDGVRLIRRLDVKVDEHGNALFREKEAIDEYGNIVKTSEPIPTGFKIRKVGTKELYTDAIDVENSPYYYEQTTEMVEKVEIADDGRI